MNFVNSCYTQMVGIKRNRMGDNLELALQRIREARKDSGLSQAEIGSRLGMSRAGYGHLESGINLMTLEDFFHLARILGRPVEYFLGLDSKLTEDEGRLLALYRAIEDPAGRQIVLATVQAAARRD